MSKFHSDFKTEQEVFFNRTESLQHRPRCVKWFLQEVHDLNIEAVTVIMQTNPQIVHWLGLTSISCSGVHGLPLWKHLCNEVAPNDDSRRLREITFLVASLCPQSNLKEMTFKSQLFAHFGIRGEWKEHLEQAVKLGFRLSKEDVDSQFKEGEPILKLLYDLNAVE